MGVANGLPCGGPVVHPQVQRIRIAQLGDRIPVRRSVPVELSPAIALPAWLRGQLAHPHIPAPRCRDQLPAFPSAAEPRERWSNEDESYIAEGPEIPGCAADGASYREAPAHVEVVIDQWIETAKEVGRPVPEPKGGRVLLA